MRSYEMGLRGVLLAACMIGMPHATWAQTASPPSDLKNAAEHHRIYCPPGIERLLPGDFYACRARYHLQRQHYRKTLDLLTRAASWANKDAQHALGLVYFNGDVPGVPQDRALGLAWLALAAERHDPLYVRSYTLARLKSDKAVVAEASRRYTSLLPVYGDKVAGERARRHFEFEVKAIDEVMKRGGKMYLAGYGLDAGSASVMSHVLHVQAQKDFAGMLGTVTVGPLQPVSGSAAATRAGDDAPSTHSTGGP